MVEVIFRGPRQMILDISSLILKCFGRCLLCILYMPFHNSSGCELLIVKNFQIIHNNFSFFIEVIILRFLISQQEKNMGMII